MPDHPAGFAQRSRTVPPTFANRRFSRLRPVRGGFTMLEVLLALEGLDLLDGDLELVCDPGVGASLTHPGPNLVELWA